MTNAEYFERKNCYAVKDVNTFFRWCQFSNSYQAMAIAKAVKECLAYPMG